MAKGLNIFGAQIPALTSAEVVTWKTSGLLDGDAVIDYEAYLLIFYNLDLDTGIEANALYHITQVIDGIESANCAVGPFMSYNIACPVLNLTVDEDSVIVDLTPPDDITRIIIQLSENQVDILDGVNDPEPFADPIATFTGLDPDTTYYVRATIITESGAGTIYTRTCAWVEFTTGEPYDPPASNEYLVQFAFDDTMLCSAEEVKGNSTSLNRLMLSLKVNSTA